VIINIIPGANVVILILFLKYMLKINSPSAPALITAGFATDSVLTFPN